MAKRKNTARKARRSACSELPAILSKFLDARCVLECALCRLEDYPDRPPGAETVCIRQAFEMLRSVYNDLDMVIIRARL